MGCWTSDRYDWDQLRESIKESGVRNSLCLALMPTASTSQILGNNECFEPFTNNIYSSVDGVTITQNFNQII